MTIIPGGVWFKDHCLKITPNKKTGGVRYRYPGEDWVEVDGDDYTLEDNVKGQCEGSHYRVSGYAKRIDQHGNPLPDQYINTLTFEAVKRILNPNNPWKFRQELSALTGFGVIRYNQAYFEYEALSGEIKDRFVVPSSFHNGIPLGRNVFSAFSNQQPSNIEIIRTTSNGAPLATPDDCGSCELTIFKNGQIVHTESKKECPEVEIISDGICAEDKPIRVEIQTTPLGFIDVTKSAADEAGEAEAAIPDECVNIYKVDAIHQLLSPSGALAGINYTLIGQYCSTPGCESPTVVRDGDQCGESCPDDTCAVSCSDHICCHDANGIAVQEIPLENYAGGN